MSQSRRRPMSSGEVASVLCVLLVLWVLPAAGQVRVSTIQEAIERWTPETQVYVMGDVGLQDAALADLEAWLKDRPWTVLLVQDATGQRFQGVDGVVREGVDAIEYGTGQGIARASGFEPDGAILSIVLAQRALYYTAGTARDLRGLGEEAFQGNLDQWAIAALRNGGDIASAVKDTVTNVDSLLAQAIAGEREGHDQITPVENAVWSSETAVRRAEATELAVRFLYVVALLTLAWLAWFLNRRRRPVKEEAESLLATRQTALDRKLEVLFGELEQKVARLVGPVSGRFEGETEELARQVRSDVGSLAILWTSAHAVLEQARERIRPRRPWPALRNLFFPGNYIRGLALLRDEPVPFDPAEGLPRLFGGERTWRDDLLGDLAGYEPFRKSFEELVEELNSRAARAVAALDGLEACLAELPPLLKKTHERILAGRLPEGLPFRGGRRGRSLPGAGAVLRGHSPRPRRP